MRSMHRVMRGLAALLLATFAWAVQAEAAVISVVPAAQSVGLGDPVSVDIVVSGLAADETVGGFSFLLSFDDTILTEVGYTIGAGMGAAPLDLTFFGPGSPLDFFVLADATLLEPALKALQGASFTLLTVDFSADAPGISPITLATSPATGVFLSDFDGLTPIPATAGSGLVCVDQPCPVPEPSFLAMFGAATFSAFMARRRRRSRE